MTARRRAQFDSWLDAHSNLAVTAVITTGLLLRLYAASGTFLDPDEALHFRMANQASLLAAYQASLKIIHPPLLVLLLYCWKSLGTSELMLRLPSVLAGTAFCWFAYRWMGLLFGRRVAWIGLLWVTFLPSMIELSAEVRQYALLLLFASASAYLLEDAFTRHSARRMWLSALCLCLAFLSHYSAAIFAVAMGLYVGLRYVRHRFDAKLAMAWVGGQLCALAIAFFLYRTHLSHLASSGIPSAGVQGLQHDEYIARSYFHRRSDHAIGFALARTGGVFQYLFGMLALGDIAYPAFIAGVSLLFWGKSQGKNNAEEREFKDNRALAARLILPFALNCAAAFAGVYPYGGTRHSAILAMFGFAGVSVAIDCCVKSWLRGTILVAALLIICAAFGAPHRPYMTRRDQSVTHMRDAIEYLHHQVTPGDVIFTDVQSSQLLTHYLCEQTQPVQGPATGNFSQFSCAGYRIVLLGDRSYTFSATTFQQRAEEMTAAYALPVETRVWIVQMGWDASLAAQLKSIDPSLSDTPVQSFGANIAIFNAKVVDRANSGHGHS